MVETFLNLSWHFWTCGIRSNRIIEETVWCEVSLCEVNEVRANTPGRYVWELFTKFHSDNMKGRAQIPNVTVLWLLLSCIVLSGSRIVVGPEIGISAWSFYGFLYYLNENAKIIPRIKPRPLSPTSLATYFFLIILNLDALYSQVQRNSLKKYGIQINTLQMEAAHSFAFLDNLCQNARHHILSNIILQKRKLIGTYSCRL